LPAAGAASQQAAGAFSSSSSSSGPSELLSELSHLPCFLLMEYVEGDRLSDSPQALQVRGFMICGVRADWLSLLNNSSV
jgi:hypothetical protein